MISGFKKKASKWAVAVLLITVLLTGCSDIKGQENTSKSIDNSASGSTQTQKENVSQNSSGSTSTKSDQKELLSDIMESAKAGKVINCDIAANETANIWDIEEKWGKADKTEEWIPEAKGCYTTYSKSNIVFGSNKGGAIFEIRSFDSQLKNISLSMVKDAFGKPEYAVKTNNQQIVGYTADTDYKLLFVFPEPSKSNKDPKLDHYCVLYPKGTVNIMSGDKGREW